MNQDEQNQQHTPVDQSGDQPQQQQQDNGQAENANGQKSFMEIKNDIIEALKECYDPEIPVNIYDLGLIYEINVDPGNNAHVLMTLTSPSCPVAGTLPGEVENRVREVSGVESAEVELTFEPMWDMEMMSEEAKLELGFM